jgi:hypothetical protein
VAFNSLFRLRGHCSILAAIRLCICALRSLMAQFRKAQSANFPVNFPVSREFEPETGSLLTAFSASKSLIVSNLYLVRMFPRVSRPFERICSHDLYQRVRNSTLCPGRQSANYRLYLARPASESGDGGPFLAKFRLGDNSVANGSFHCSYPRSALAFAR